MYHVYSKYFLLGIGISMTVTTEFILKYLKNKILSMKSLSIITEQSIIKTKEDSPQKYMITTQLLPSSYTMPINPIYTNIFLLKSKSIVGNSFFTTFINPRKYTIEKLFPPISYLLDILCEMNSDHRRSNLANDLCFLVGGDQITLYGSSKINQIHEINSSLLEIMPEVIVQGNKKDIIDYYREGYQITEKLRFLFLIPSGLYITGKVIEYVYNKVCFALKSRNQYHESQNKCANCHINPAEIALKSCNHFNLCQDCFDKKGKLCYICNTNSDFLIISSKK